MPEGQHCVKGTEPEKSRPTELANVLCNESPQYDIEQLLPLF